MIRGWPWKRSLRSGNRRSGRLHNHFDTADLQSVPIRTCRNVGRRFLLGLHIHQPMCQRQCFMHFMIVDSGYPGPYIRKGYRCRIPSRSHRLAGVEFRRCGPRCARWNTVLNNCRSALVHTAVPSRFGDAIHLRDSLSSRGKGVRSIRLFVSHRISHNSCFFYWRSRRPAIFLNRVPRKNLR